MLSAVALHLHSTSNAVMTYHALSRRLLEISSSIVEAAEQFESVDTSITKQLIGHAEAIQALSLSAHDNLHRDPLPPAQARVLAFLRQFIFDQKIPPTRLEIAQGLGFRSENSAQDHLVALHQKGLVTLLPGTARGIRLVTSRPVLTRAAGPK